MSGLVVDASVALAWCFPDEANAYADHVLAALKNKSIVVPSIWPLEITNAVLVGERSKRITADGVARFHLLLENLPIVVETASINECVGEILSVSRKYGLTAYDAAYLELALRKGLPLATLDSKMRTSAVKAGVKIIEDLS